MLSRIGTAETFVIRSSKMRYGCSRFVSSIILKIVMVLREIRWQGAENKE
jgi:hypothetical protein